MLKKKEGIAGILKLRVVLVCCKCNGEDFILFNHVSKEYSSCLSL